MLGYLADVVADVRFSWRQFRRQPRFWAAVVLTLAVGIGANTAVFSVVNGVLLQPLPYPEPERVVYLARQFAGGGVASTLSTWRYDYIRRNATVFEAVAAHGGWTTAIGTDDASSDARGLRASAEFFRVNGIDPTFGRAFSAEEDRAGGPSVVVISDALWRDRFGVDPSVLGRTLELDGRTHTIIGVMPATFRFPEQPGFTDFIVPYRIEPHVEDISYNTTVRARLARGISREQALAELRTLSERFRLDYPEHVQPNERPFHIADFADVQLRGTDHMLWLMLGAVGFVLLIACVNVANLMLVRAVGRQRELAIRAAIGAGRRRLVRQLVTESVLVGLLGAGAGLLVGLWSLDALLALAPPGFTQYAKGEIGLDARVLAVTITLGAVTGIALGIAAAARTGGVNSSPALRVAGGARTGSLRGRRTRSALVAGEVALAVVLLTGAGLLIASITKLMSVDTGFEPAGLMAFEIERMPGDYTVEQVASFERQVLERIRALPAVVEAGATSTLPLLGQFNFPMTIVGRPEATHSAVQWHTVSSGYFEALRAPIRRGRAFTAADDRSGAAPVAIVNESFARAYFGDGNPLGARITIGAYQGENVIPGFAEPEHEIVGVVADIRAFGLRQSAPETMYTPRAQTPPIDLGADGPVGVWALGGLVVRAEGQALLAEQVRDIMRETDPRVGSPRPSGMNDVIASTLRGVRFYATLLGTFAAVALGLAAIGIYGVVGFTVEQRAGEMGIRMALGADQRRVLGLVLWQALVPVLVGLAIGLGAAAGLMHLLRGLLYAVGPTDSATFASAAVTLTAVAFIAAYLPARRAASVDPALSLRSE